MIVKTYDLIDFMEDFRSYDRDYFSKEGYKALFDLIDETSEEPFEMDVIGLCCDFSEDSYEEIVDRYFRDEKDELIIEGIPQYDLIYEKLSYYTWCQQLTDSIIYQNY